MNRTTDRADRDSQYIGMLEDVVFQPVFIMGDHRTGTTVLYEILGATECFNIVTAYHIIYRSELVHNYINQIVDSRKQQLAALFDQKGLTDRGIDRVQAGPDTPEEYGFALQNTGYRPQLKPGNLASFVELCKKIQLTSDASRPLLLKNPWDFSNFMYVREAFPDSKFIFMHRNPIHTINSQLKATRSLVSTRNEYVALVVDWYDQIFRQPTRLQMTRFLFSTHFDLGLRVMTRHVARATDYFLKHVPSLPREEYVSVKYEDLCREPRRVVREILDWLQFHENRAVEYESFISVRGVSLLSEVERNQESILARMRPYFERCGYKLEDGLS